MSSYNRVVLLGNLTRDPQLKFLSSKTPLVEFGVAMNRKYKTGGGEQREEVCFVDISAFGKMAETINQYFHKGDAILLEGRLTFSAWDDKQTGAKRTKLSVTAESFQFVGNKTKDGGDPPAGQRQEAQPPYDPNKQEFQDQDIPFVSILRGLADLIFGAFQPA